MKNEGGKLQHYERHMVHDSGGLPTSLLTYVKQAVDEVYIIRSKQNSLR